MKKPEIIAFGCIFVIFLAMPFAASQSSDDSTVSIEVDRKCSATTYDFRFTTNVQDDQGYPLIGTGGTGYFSYLPANSGEMAYIHENISIYRYNTTSGDRTKQMNLDVQNISFSESYLFNSTNFDADSDVSRLLGENGTVMRAPYWYDKPFENWNTSRPPSLEKQKEFIATTNFTDGVYETEMEFGYNCEFRPNDGSTVTDVESDSSFNFSDFNPSQYNQTQLVERFLIDGLNISVAEKDENYARTVNKTDRSQDFFKVVTVQGNGSTPDEVSDTNEEIGRNLETDADEVSNLSKNSSLENDVNESVNSSRETSANQTTDFEQNSSLNSDAEQTTDATEVEGNNPDQPGETPVPEPQPTPEPEPTPLLSVDLRPLETSYTADRGAFTEIGMELNNTGEETLSNLELSPRFSEGMDWQSQSVTIDSLEVGDSVNETVFVNPGESVEPGIYQVPVYASTPDEDIGSQYVNVEVTEEPVQASSLSISEAPQDIRFEMNENYTVPVLLENSGDSDLENVSIELQNTENCGDYTADEIESIASGETASVSVNFEASDALEECEATIVASSSSGSFAFSEMTVQNVEEKGIVPQEFRVPIIASLWTIMLIAYTVVTKRYGLNSLTVKVPMVLLVVGEAFILIYLSSAYYDIVPPGLLPFSSA